MSSFQARSPARAELRRIGRYATVGLGVVALEFGLYTGLVLAGLWYVAAKAVSLAIATAVAYLGHRNWTFADGPRRERTVHRFLVVQGTCITASFALLAFLVEVAGVDEIAAQAIVLPAIAAASFLVQRTWTFGAGAPAP
jgi:putative flippase GtrA